MKRSAMVGILVVWAVSLVLGVTGCLHVVDTLRAWVQDLDGVSGRVTINGVDTKGPFTPFIFFWGDGTVDVGWFPMSHAYADTARDYEVMVTAQYESGRTSSELVHVVFSTLLEGDSI